MPLTPEQQQDLQDAIRCYAFPVAYFDFEANHDVSDLTIQEVEGRIRERLISNCPDQVEDGLASILYWGFSQMGLGMVRANRFRGKVKLVQERVEEAADLFHANHRPTLLAIKRLQLPQFSGVSFTSKIRMFLDPWGSATLDQQIMKIDEICPDTVLAQVSFRVGDTQIRVSRKNSEAYEAWCTRLDEIRSQYFPELRTVDIERGLFHLVQTRQVSKAAGILREA